MMTSTFNHVLTMNDISKEDLHELLEDALVMKQQVKKGIPHEHLRGKTLGMIFEKASTRTRISFEVGMTQLGGHAIFLSPRDMQLDRGESVEDTARVLSRYVDGIMIRTFSHSMVETFADHSSVPVINGLTDHHHPTQVLADLMTIYEEKKQLDGLTMAFVGDGNNNMTHSLIQGAVLAGMNIQVSSPSGYEPSAKVWNEAEAKAAAQGSGIHFYSNPYKAVTGADVVVTDVWTSMGDEEEAAERLNTFRSYQVNEALMAKAAEGAMFLHCLPAHRGEEVTAEVIDGPQSHVFDEAENRLHAQKALLKNLLA
ncbi:ornithine carbamoyltransferase [Alkalicoccus chagannorensis]|uniref:ornithine carbamoyltransferase n=1 Tax=Alkalicoccus chagannorensis TaxID=427072 RepID=UPI000420A144|nr:ornithine carbamoyltransferase [Alkalicoccus chagannorensis]